MDREVSLEEISDGKLYGLNDMVKAGCSDCQGCSSCCKGMGISITLDPLDIWRITSNLGCTLEELLAGRIELNVVDGIILPNLMMAGEEECCTFLNAEGRCSIHPFRPGICRLFPLGRYYEDRGFRYFLQVHECKKENKTKVKVRKWVDTPDLKEYEQFISDWHYLLRDIQLYLKENPDEQKRKAVTLYLLQHFYMKPYEAAEEFYGQFSQRYNEAAELLYDKWKFPLNLPEERKIR